MTGSVVRHDAPVFEYLRIRAGLSHTSLQRNGASKAVSRLQHRLNLQDQRALVRRLAREADLFDALIDEVTVGETHFFRHKAQLDAIRTVILPSLAQDRPANHTYRIWSAGCATGEEAYSLAILVGEEGLAGRTSILATDISKPAIERAKKGEYSSWSFRGLNRSFVRQHFDSIGPVARVRKAIRDRVKFKVLNLALDEYPSPETGTTDLDLILCRNVLIYFDSDAVAQTAARLYACLAPDGWLVMGPSDPPLWHHVPLTPILLPGAVIYRRASNRARPVPQLPTKPKQAKNASHALPQAKRQTTRRAITKHPTIEQRAGSTRATPSDPLQEIAQVARSQGVAKAEALATAQLMQNPLATEIRYLRSILLMSLNKDDEAIAELRRLVYLDRSLAAAHFALGTLFHKKRDSGRARRSFTNAYRLAATLPPKQIVSMTEGMTAAELASLAKERLSDFSDAATGSTHD